MMLITQVRGSRRWGVSALLLLALAAGAALLSIRPAAAYVTRPDLQVSLTRPANWSLTDATLQTFTVTVRNPREWDPELHREYGAPASGVVAQYTAPVYMTVQSVSATNGFSCAVAGRVVTCTGGAIANGGSATITIVLKDSPPPPPFDSTAYCLEQHTAAVDPANQIVERDESNNSVSGTFFNPMCFT